MTRSRSVHHARDRRPRAFSPRVRWTIEGFNLLDARASDIDYFFESRLRDEPAPVADRHFHAAIPRSARMAVQVSF